MYGYPTQTVQETVDSLEMVRQLFEIGVLQSGFWHQFALTAHSPIGLNPSAYHIIPNIKPITFANNDIDFHDTTGIDHNQFSFGLKKSLFNYMHGIGFELPLQDWFDFKIPRTTIAPDFIHNCLETDVHFNIKPNAKILWLGTKPWVTETSKTKKGHTYYTLQAIFHSKTDTFTVTFDKHQGIWFLNILDRLSPNNAQLPSFSDLKKDYETQFEDFELFWFSKPMNVLRDNGLLVL
jgi:hypothetical protein